MKNWILQYAQQSSSEEDEDGDDATGPGDEASFDPVRLRTLKPAKADEIQLNLQLTRPSLHGRIHIHTSKGPY